MSGGTCIRIQRRAEIGSHTPAPAGCCGASALSRRVTEVLMWDVIMIAIGIGLFGLSIGYAYACDRL